MKKAHIQRLFFLHILRQLLCPPGGRFYLRLTLTSPPASISMKTLQNKHLWCYSSNVIINLLESHRTQEICSALSINNALDAVNNCALVHKEYSLVHFIIIFLKQLFQITVVLQIRKWTQRHTQTCAGCNSPPAPLQSERTGTCVSFHSIFM